MYKKHAKGKQIKGLAKDIRKQFGDVLNQFQLELRLQNINKQQNLEKLDLQVRKIARKVNQFSNLLLEDDFQFQSLADHPLLMIRYCDIVFSMLIDSYSSEFQGKSKMEGQKTYNQNNVYEVVSHLRLQNFDLRDKIKTLQKQLILAKQRAECAEEVTLSVKAHTQQFLKNYETNFCQICDLLKKAQSNQIELLQNNRYLKEELQSLSIQFERYKQYFKQGPSLKDKEFKLKSKLQRQYQQKLSNAIKQVQTSIRSQLQKSIVQKFDLKDIKNLRF